jgi:hypothetical protein
MENTEPFYEHMDDVHTPPKPATREELIQVLRSVMWMLDNYGLIHPGAEYYIRDILSREERDE